MEKKTKIVVGVTVVILSIILLLCLLNKKNEDEKILKTITDIGFVNNNDSFLYSKQISELDLEQYNERVSKKLDSIYEILYFNINSYHLIKDKISYSNGITKNFTPTYDYTNNKLTYDYRISFNNTSIIIEGDFNIETRKFTCETTFSYNINVENAQQDICNKLKVEIENFEYESNNLIKDSKLLEYMIKK